MPVTTMKVDDMAAVSPQGFLKQEDARAFHDEKVKLFADEVLEVEEVHPQEKEDALLKRLAECKAAYEAALEAVEKSNLKKQSGKEARVAAQEFQGDVFVFDPSMVSKFVPIAIREVKLDELDKADRQKFIELVRLRIQIQDEILMLVVNNKLPGWRSKKLACLKSSNAFISNTVDITSLKEYYYNLCGGKFAISDDQNLKLQVAKLDAMLSLLQVRQDELKNRQYHPYSQASELGKEKVLLDSLTEKRNLCRQECQVLKEKEKSYFMPSESSSLKLLELGSLEEELREQTILYQKKVYQYNDILDAAREDMKELQELQEDKSEMYALHYEHGTCQKRRERLKTNKAISAHLVFLDESKALELKEKLESRTKSYQEKLQKAQESGKKEEPYSEVLKKAKEAVEIHVYKDLKSTVPPKYLAVRAILIELELKTSREEKKKCLREFLDSQKTKDNKESIDYYQRCSFFTYGRGKTDTRMLLEELCNALEKGLKIQENIKCRSLSRVIT